MSGDKILLDTNIVLYLLDGDSTLAEFLNGKVLCISIISEIELLSFSGLKTSDEKIIKSFLSECLIFPINEKIKDSTIKTRKSYRTKLPDSIIASTSLFLGIPFISADSGFKKITELDFIYFEK
jgi:predicted nucleic acid-binding protein